MGGCWRSGCEYPREEALVVLDHLSELFGAKGASLILTEGDHVATVEVIACTGEREAQKGLLHSEGGRERGC